MSQDSASQSTQDKPTSKSKTGGQRRTVQCWVDSPLPEDRTDIPHHVKIRGWMFSTLGRPVQGIASVEGMPDLPFTAGALRPDVLEHFQAKGQTVADPCGFERFVPFPEDGTPSVELRLTFSDGNFTTPPKVFKIERASMLLWPPPPVRTTLISHFYNEEYLLPMWLRHHLPLFDHGILINRCSTDRSVEICRKLAPQWEVRDAACPEFDAEEVDREVMEIEREVSGWKLALNTTEFLHVRSRQSFLAAIQAYGRRAYGVRVIMLMDPKHVPYPEFNTSKPLASQRHYGVIGPAWGGCRFIHNHEDGGYVVGRHFIPHPHELFPQGGAVILKTYFSPWNEAFKRRRLQIHATVSEKSKALLQGNHHVATQKELDDLYNLHIPTSTDLRNLRDLAWLFKK